jgi:hypothetical protein
MFGITLRLTTVSLTLLLCVPWPSQAEEIPVNSIGIRSGVTGSSPIGEKEEGITSISMT